MGRRKLVAHAIALNGSVCFALLGRAGLRAFLEIRVVELALSMRFAFSAFVRW